MLKSSMEQLFEALKQGADKLLLFTQNVKKVQVFELMSHKNVNNMTEVMTIEKNLLKVLRPKSVPERGTTFSPSEALLSPTRAQRILTSS